MYVKVVTPDFEKPLYYVFFTHFSVCVQMEFTSVRDSYNHFFTVGLAEMMTQVFTLRIAIWVLPVYLYLYTQC